MLQAVFRDVGRGPRPERPHARAREVFIVEKLSGPQQDDYRGEAIAPLPQVLHGAEDVDVVPQNVLVIEGDDLGRGTGRTIRPPQSWPLG
jgi:hypothetical protein